MSKFCPSCGEELVDNAKFCKNCGKNIEWTNQPHSNQTDYTRTVPVVEKSHTIAIVLGYICAVLIPLFGIIFAIYLLTRNDSPGASKHGKIVLAIAVIVWLISFFLFFRW